MRPARAAVVHLGPAARSGPGHTPRHRERAHAPLPLASDEEAVRFDRALPGFTPQVLVGNPARRVIERSRGER